MTNHSLSSFTKPQLIKKCQELEEEVEKTKNLLVEQEKVVHKLEYDLDQTQTITEEISDFDDTISGVRVVVIGKTNEIYSIPGKLVRMIKDSSIPNPKTIKLYL